MFATPLETYKTVQKSTMSGREIEASVLIKAANMLKDCQSRWDTDGHTARLDEALRYNQLVWSIFQGDLSKDDHPLPKKLREDILSLSAFIDKRVFEVMAYPSPEKLTIIININQNIAGGLKGL